MKRICSIAFLRLGDTIQPPAGEHLRDTPLYQLVYQDKLKTKRNIDSTMLSSRGLAFVASIL